MSLRFQFYLANAAGNNSGPAQLRESTRMACVARALASLGHRVQFSSIPKVLAQSRRWRFFSGIRLNHSAKGIEVRPAESLGIRHLHATDVAFKCSVGTDRDPAWLRRSIRLMVAHEFNPDLNDEGKVLHVPFLVHDRVIDGLIQEGLFDAYLDDDLDTIRKRANVGRQGLVGFCGCGEGRAPFFRSAPDWVTSRFYTSHPMTGWEHARWISGFRAGVALRGDTPKTNLPPLLAMLGVPIIAVEPERNTPPLDDDSMIRFRSWDQVRERVDDIAGLERIADNATRVYRTGWSPLGIARQIVERIS